MDDIRRSTSGIKKIIKILIKRPLLAELFLQVLHSLNVNRYGNKIANYRGF